MSCLFRYKLLIVRGREQAIKFAWILQRELHHPRAMRIFIYSLRRGGQVPVDLGHGAGRGSKQVRHSFHRLDRAKRLACGQFGADLRSLDEDDVSQRLLRVVGDSNRAGGSVHLNPFVLFCVLAICCIGYTSFYLLAPKLLAKSSVPSVVTQFSFAAYKPASARPPLLRPDLGFPPSPPCLPLPTPAARRPAQYSSSRMAREIRL